MSSAASIFASLRSLATKFPKSLQSTRSLDPTTLKPINPSFFLFFKPISFQNIPSAKSPPPISASSSSSSPSSAMSLQPIEELPPKLQEIVKLFQSVQEPKAKYEQLLFYGKNLKPLEPHLKTRANKVEGCVSQVWVRAYLDTNKNVVFEADSDSVLTKGLAALLVQGLSGRPVDEVLRVSPDFVVLLGLQQSLTPSRNNGFLNMLKLMQKKAIELYVEAEKGSESVHVTKTDEESDGGSSNEVGHGEIEKEKENENLVPDGGTQDSPVGLDSDESLGSRGIRIREILDRELNPMELEVEDVSYQHAGHAGVRGSDGETHFNVKVVSKEFEGKSLVKRHRLIYGLLQDELQSGLHALSIVAKTPAEMSGR